MKVLIPKSSGFCPGVKRAEEGVLALRKQMSLVHVHGPLIHNQSYIEHLATQNITTIPVDQLPAGSTLVIRTHGIPKDEEERLAKNFILKDMTCPIVKRVQKKVEKASQEGAFVMISGKNSHAEVIGLKSYARWCKVIETTDELAEFLANPCIPKEATKIFVLSQTTHSHAFFRNLCKELHRHFDGSLLIEEADTVCPVTENKEKESLELQKQADATVVIGDPHSSNSKKLFNILKEANEKTFFIRTAQDIPSLPLDDVQTIMLVSSTSTPRFIEDAVHKALEAL
ncbi:MAG: 4-hydroxy-3-methylbut-2-enyl diphosphate reductase [Brevinema sp.]